MIAKIEEFKQINGVWILKVFCKPTKTFPNGGWFYAPAEALSLVQNYNWYLAQYRNRVEVRAGVWNGYCKTIIYFHKELFKFYQGYNWQGDIDHINMIEFDNIDANLNAVTAQKNSFNRFTKGYSNNNNRSTFQPRIMLNSKTYYPLSVTHSEGEACIQQNYIEQVWLKDKLGAEYYMFDFKKYRRGSEDILDLERIGKISEEEATYRHILRYSDNAWFYLRYDLQDYFKQYHIPIPQYSLDTNGFMIHPITGQKLCPF